MAPQGAAGPGWAWHGTVRRGMARIYFKPINKARRGMARLGEARQGWARQGWARRGMARHGLAWRGRAGHGMVGRGAVRRGIELASPRHDGAW